MGKHQQWQWADGPVDAQAEHIELRHGDAAVTSYENWMPVARIGKPTGRRFLVQWLIKGDSEESRAILADARRELDFYLVEKRELNPWAYARYHCSTSGNMYSRVHWSYFPNGNEDERAPDEGDCL